MSTVNCPACDQELELDPAYRDWQVRCPQCGREFVPNSSKQTRGEPDEEEEEAEYVYGPEGLEHDQARQYVSAPGIWLEILGWLGALLTAGGCAILVLLAIDAGNNNPGGDDEITLLLFGGCLAVFGLPCSIVIGVGGRHMRHLSSRGWALAAAILSLLFFVLFGVCGTLHAGIGIWALVTLEKPAVRRAFGLPGRRRYRD